MDAKALFLLFFSFFFFAFTDRPDTPPISNTETTVPGCNVTIKWNKPASNGCPILFYTVHYKKESRSEHMEWIIENVTDPNVNHLTLILNCTTTYLFEVKAWNKEGGSDSPLKAWPITTGGGETDVQKDPGDTSSAGTFLLFLPCYFWILFRTKLFFAE